MAAMTAPISRAAELAGRLEAVHARISAASDRAGRLEEPRLIVVTKYFPASDVGLLHSLGIRDVGENRDQEASGKASGTSALSGLRWHFIGQLQTNKARSVARYAYAVHSVDRLSLVHALDKAVIAEQDRARADGAAPRAPLGCYLQIELGGSPSGPGRGGAQPGDVPRLADAVDQAAGLELRGVMAVAPVGIDPAVPFAQLAEISAQLTADHPAATEVSAGMSGDLEAAIGAGATHLRIGSDVLGQRPPVR